MRNKFQGFTLIELMIVVAIIGILASIAVPLYNGYILRGKLAAAYSELSTLRVRLEQYYQDNRSYESGATAGACAATMPSSPYFTFTCALGADSQSFTVSATGKAAVGTGDFVFTVNDAGTKTSAVTGAALAEGWTSSSSCWVRNKNGAC